ncbi:MAG: sensory box sigma-54 dependent transcriptional regulator [Bacillota bacterium]|jgi:transcriptional regulator of acetoin/glycerol metabolism|nr:sensory box sigma-54 dependent transcriptional regulator [Bacillota bacterium]
MFDENMVLKVAKEWNSFIINDNCSPTITRSEIYESWKRSKEYGVDPFTLKNKVLSKTELEKKLNKKSELIKVAMPYINKIYSFVQNSGFVVFLTDEDGIILSLVGDDDIISKTKDSSSLQVGVDRSEKYSGTNAMGTCIALNKPIQMYGPEHWVKYQHKHTCSAAPIHDIENNIIGSLDVTGAMENVHSHTLGMVVAAVDGIEKELKLNNAYNKLFIENNKTSTTLNSINTALIVISKDGNILNINKSAAELFNINCNNTVNEKINDVLDYDKTKINLEHLDKNYMDTELEIQGKKFSITTATYNNKSDQSEGSVISFREMKRIHKLVNKYSGFSASYTVDDIVGNSSQISYVKNLCLKAAKSTSNVLILGESGTGKELMAQSIHNASSRSNEPFIAINCGALPKGLIESELFGYEGGSFTGANKEGKPGKFELADGGTIFLDEIGDMPLDTQVSLLRVLQTKSLIRIGGTKPVPVDIRIIAATNKNLLEEISQNSFREDLYYRLNVLTINVPPLRERKADIKLLSNHFLNYYNRTLNKNIKVMDDKVLEAFSNYSWPGNIREMENVIERAINIVDTDKITINDLPMQFLHLGSDNILANSKFKNNKLTKSQPDSNFNMDLLDKKKFLEKDEIEKALYINRGSATKAAEYLGISRKTIYRKMEKYNIVISDFR